MQRSPVISQLPLCPSVPSLGPFKAIRPNIPWGTGDRQSVFNLLLPIQSRPMDSPNLEVAINMMHLFKVFEVYLLQSAHIIAIKILASQANLASALDAIHTFWPHPRALLLSLL